MHILFSAILILQNSKVNTCATVSFLMRLQLHLKKVLQHNFIKIRTLPQVFSCEFCEFFKNTLFLQNTSGCYWQVFCSEFCDIFQNVFFTEYFPLQCSLDGFTFTSLPQQLCKSHLSENPSDRGSLSPDIFYSLLSIMFFSRENSNFHSPQ